MTRNTLKRLFLAAAIALASSAAFAQAWDKACHDVMIATAARNKESASWDVYNKCVADKGPVAAGRDKACHDVMIATAVQNKESASWDVYNKCVADKRDVDVDSLTALAQNTVPFPDYPDPNVACNVCIASEQNGYDMAKAVWPHLTQQYATICANFLADSHQADIPLKYTVLGECATGYFAVQPKPPPPPFVKK